MPGCAGVNADVAGSTVIPVGSGILQGSNGKSSRDGMSLYMLDPVSQGIAGTLQKCTKWGSMQQRLHCSKYILKRHACIRGTYKTPHAYFTLHNSA